MSHVDCTIRRVAPMSIQPHVLFNRDGLWRIVADALSAGVLPEDRTESFDAQIIPGSDGLPRLHLKRPIYYTEVNEVTKRTQAAQQKAGVRAHQYSLVLPEVEVDIPPALNKQGKPRKVLSSVNLLTRTGKMGCYSFNLPAGPVQWHGCCPASAYGFPMLSDEDRLDQAIADGIVRLSAQERKLRKDKQLETLAARLQTTIHPEESICGGCYGMKANYGKPSMQVGMAIRAQFAIAQLHMDPAGLVEYFVRAIRAGQLYSVRMRKQYGWYQLKHKTLTKKVDGKEVKERVAYRDIIPHPAFFRIHDVGDCFDMHYARVWFDVARAFLAEHKHGSVKLPPVRFWMPTRMWLTGSKFAQLVKDAPPNLHIKPSAYHFGDPAPQLSGYGSGAGTVCISSAMEDSDITSAESVVGPLHPDQMRRLRPSLPVVSNGTGIICPAYHPEDWGGGGAIGGNCVAASGIGQDQASEAVGGMGCRVCWLNPETRVVYGEH